jgi:hypothetical protein
LSENFVETGHFRGNSPAKIEAVPGEEMEAWQKSKSLMPRCAKGSVPKKGLLQHRRSRHNPIY